MIFLSNNATYFFAVFLMNYRKNFDALSVFLLVMEFSAFFWSAVLTLRGCWIITSTRVFNRNLNIVMAGILLQWMENMVGRLMIMPYQKGWVQLPGNDPKKTYSEFFTNVTSERILIKDELMDFPFFSIGSILLTHYMVCAVLGLTGLTVERSLATFWINDYEKKSRNWIPIFVLLSFQIVSYLIAYSAINILLNIYIWLAIGVLVLTTNFLLLAYIWYWNVRVHRILDQSKIPNSKYTLQARFQAKENARSLSFLKITVVFISASLIFECIFFILQAFNVFQEYQVILYYLVDYCNVGHPIALIPLAMISVPAWRRRFFAPFRKISRVKEVVPSVRTVENSLEKETDEYFSQLNKAWA